MRTDKYEQIWRCKTFKNKINIKNSCLRAIKIGSKNEEN